ncbi:MAG: Nif3-like dinuclear metal center hexameric protein [Micrococcales bacterium]
MVALAKLLDTFEALWPRAGAEDWDSPGLTTGSPNQEISRVMLSVDVTADVVACVTEARCDLLISHHPFIMRGVKTLAENTAKGAVLAGAIRANLALFSAHTNADVVEDGVSDAIAKALGLQAVSPLVGHGSTGHGRVGTLKDPQSLGEFASLVARTLPNTATGVRVAGDYNQIVERVALCGGAGDSFIPDALEARADVYLSSDLRHHVVQDARELAIVGRQMSLIDVSHWAAEFMWLDIAAAQLRNIYPELAVEVCDLRTDPWEFVVTQ